MRTLLNVIYCHGENIPCFLLNSHHDDNFFSLKSTKYYKNRPRYPEIQTTKPYNGIGWTEPRAEDVLGIIIPLPILYYQNETLIELVCQALWTGGNICQAMWGAGQLTIGHMEDLRLSSFWKLSKLQKTLLIKIFLKSCQT